MEWITVTSVERMNNGTFQVCTDAEEKALLFDSVQMYCGGVRPGRAYPAERWEEIKTDGMQRKARSLALKYLTGRDYASGALYKKLIERGIEEPIAAKTISRCIELGEINDERYALRAAEYCCIQKRYSGMRAYQWMVQKGIPKELARDAIEQVTSKTDIVGQIKELIQKRYAQKIESGDYRQKQNVIAALARRGYRIYDIQTAVEEYLSEAEETERD